MVEFLGVTYERWPFEQVSRVNRRDVAAAFGVPLSRVRVTSIGEPIRQGSAREALDLLLDEIAFGVRCATCTGMVPGESDDAQVCRCGTSAGAWRA